MITREEFVNQFEETLTEMYNIMKAKNADYANDWNPFANFELVEQLGITSLEKAILVRMSDKMSRIANLVEREAKVKDESISDTLSDLANYSVILKIFLDNKSK